VLLASLAIGAGAAASLGCGNQCDRNPNQPPIVYTGGSTTAPGTPYATYTSSPCKPTANDCWTGYLDFPSGRTYRFIHQMGGVPQGFQCFGAFDFNGVTPDAGKPSGTAEINGNQCTIEHVNEKFFDVRNDTCSDIKLRVVAWNPFIGSIADSGTPPIRDAQVINAPDATDGSR
jgi:hypothetical protein